MHAQWIPDIGEGTRRFLVSFQTLPNDHTRPCTVTMSVPALGLSQYGCMNVTNSETDSRIQISWRADCSRAVQPFSVLVYRRPSALGQPSCTRTSLPSSTGPCRNSFLSRHLILADQLAIALIENSTKTTCQIELQRWRFSATTFDESWFVWCHRECIRHWTKLRFWHFGSIRTSSRTHLSWILLTNFTIWVMDASSCEKSGRQNRCHPVCDPSFMKGYMI